MTRKQKRKIALSIIAIFLAIFGIERIYNLNSEFHVTAMDASYYGFIDARLTTDEKLYDFEYLCDVLEENYPFFKVNKRLNNVDWLANKNKYKRIIRNTKNDAEFYMAMDKILNDLHNGHVNILDGNSYRKLYKTYYTYYSSSSDPYRYLSKYDVFTNPFVMNRYQFSGTQEELKNADVLSNDAKLETKILIKDKVAYMKFSSMANYSTSQEDREKIKEFLNEVQDYEKLIIDIRGNGGGDNSYWEYIVALLTDKPLHFSYYAFFKDSHLNTYNLSPYKLTNVKTVKILNEQTLSQFPEEVTTDFDYYNRYTININPWTLNVNSFDYIAFKGKIYILVDRGVFSTAEKFASFAKDTGFATLIGEPTGGERVFEEIPLIYLPNSKFVVRFSRELGLNADGTINMETKTTPHILVDPTYNEDFTKDACIQAAIND